MFLCHNVLDFIVPISYLIIYHKAQGEYHCKGEFQLTSIQILIADTGRQTMCSELPRIHLLFVTNTILYLNAHRPCLLLLITWNWHLHHLFITGCLAWLMVFMMKSKLYRWKRMPLSRWTTLIPSEKENRVTSARYFKFTGVSIIFFLSFFLFIFFFKLSS